MRCLTKGLYLKIENRQQETYGAIYNKPHCTPNL